MSEQPQYNTLQFAVLSLQGQKIPLIALLTLNEPLLPRRYVRVDSHLNSKTGCVAKMLAVW
jgi:hypothetical protein